MSTISCSNEGLPDLSVSHTVPISLNLLKICLSTLLESIYIPFGFCKSLLIKVTDYHLASSNTAYLDVTFSKLKYIFK